jgi:prepilin-type N-terminal cleavage/methylation domain-containing protein
MSPRCVGAHRKYRRGFTLIEVLMALVVSAIAILGARFLLETLGGQTLRVVKTASEIDRDANGERLLRAILARTEVPSALDSTFGGDERRAHFGSWCDVPRGWLERCRVELTVDQAADGFAITARLSTGEVVIVQRGRNADGLRYLLDPADGGRWLRQWPNSSAPPLALGILVDGDTLIARIGERG